MFQATHNLYLYSQASLTIDQLREHVQAIQLISTEVNQQELTAQRYRLGEHFFKHIALVGCMPHLQTSPPPNEDAYAYIELHAQDTLRRVSASVKQCTCPNCGRSINPHQAFKNSPNCDSCGALLKIDAILPSKKIVFGNCAIRIGNIYEAEARPNVSFLDSLNELSGTPWQYSYIRT